jgi:hypothetical protein
MDSIYAELSLSPILHLLYHNEKENAREKFKFFLGICGGDKKSLIFALNFDKFSFKSMIIVEK